METLKKKLLIYLMKKELKKAVRSWDSEEHSIMKRAKDDMCDVYKRTLLFLEL